MSQKQARTTSPTILEHDYESNKQFQNTSNFPSYEPAKRGNLSISHYLTNGETYDSLNNQVDTANLQNSAEGHHILIT